MSLNLSEKDHIHIDDYLETVLKSYKTGEMTFMEARESLAGALTFAAAANPDFVTYLKARTNP